MVSCPVQYQSPPESLRAQSLDCSSLFTVPKTVQSSEVCLFADDEAIYLSLLSPLIPACSSRTYISSSCGKRSLIPGSPKSCKLQNSTTHTVHTSRQNTRHRNICNILIITQMNDLTWNKHINNTTNLSLSNTRLSKMKH